MHQVVSIDPAQHPATLLRALGDADEVEQAAYKHMLDNPDSLIATMAFVAAACNAKQARDNYGRACLKAYNAKRA